MAQKMNFSLLISLVSLMFFLFLFFSDCCVCEKKISSLETCISVEKFSIERVNKSGAIFDSTKLR